MPRKPIDYSKTVIYKLVCNDIEVTDVYVGSTTSMVKRKNKHKCACNTTHSKKRNLKIYKIIRNNGGWSNWTMILIENYPCKNKLEASARERHWFELLNATMNTQVPSRTQAQYIKDNKEALYEYRKQHYRDNKDMYLEKQKQYNEVNKEYIAQYKKQYREKNEQAIKQHEKEYRERNKENINKKIQCNVCNCFVVKRNFKEHEQTSKHQKNLNLLEDENQYDYEYDDGSPCSEQDYYNSLNSTN